ncbi:hypothetical protein HSR122_0098 [Halapricum desulfuricans]|uniref:Uncharacterized protein n=1 Tax=Halapricum desulfuricans TaxID=2841257 RepID=A0A897MZL1_9EURY|nr:hypothetical protein HSR122_0098 [Halapricum desulfuricans]
MDPVAAVAGDSGDRSDTDPGSTDSCDTLTVALSYSKGRTSRTVTRSGTTTVPLCSKARL